MATTIAPTFSVTNVSSCSKSMAPRAHSSLHLPQASFFRPLAFALKYAQLARSITGMFGTACGNGT